MGVVQMIKYSQVELGLLRVQDGLKLIATITLHQNKRKLKTIRSSQDEM